jgi:hypothetical protein
MLERPTLCLKAPDYAFFAVKNDQMRDRRKLSSIYFISVEQYRIGMSILLTNFYLNFQILTTTVKAGNFVTFFAQINFFLKNALR